ncbi:MAG: SDR family oxidoreductase, partial [Actinomycetota bacterium]
ARIGLPDVLVNNAAGNFPVPAEDMSPNAWRAVTRIVLDGTFFCCREFGRRHIAARTPGNIVNIGASYSWTGGPGFAHSAAAKAGVKNLTETLAVEWAPYGVRVNYLVPGLIPHDDEAAQIRAVPGRGGAEAASVPAGRVGTPRELGWAATFLASPFASYVTGATLVVDGANWQRRAMLQPHFTPIREQLGRGDFEA